MTQTILTTAEVADRYYELANESKWADIWDELFGQDAVNIEPEHVASMGVPVITKGIEAIKAKARARSEMIETIHSQHCGQPAVSGDFFSVALGRDLTLKGKPRMSLQEIAVFHVREGKIILEQFFY